MAVPRQLSRRTALGGLALLLGGCGFRLRGSPELAFRSLYIDAPPRSLLTEELRRQLATMPELRLSETPAEAEVRLDVLGEGVTRTVSAITAAAQVREFSVRTQLRFRVRTPGGRELIPETELSLAELMSYNEADALGKESEEADLVRQMQRDIVAQLLRRLAAVRL